MSKRLTRREVQAWLAPIRKSLSQMMEDSVDSIRGYPVTHLMGRYERTDWTFEGFERMIARMLPHADMQPVGIIRRKIAAGIPLSVQEIEAAFRALVQIEQPLTRIPRDILRDAILTEQIQIELEEHQNHG